MGVIRGTNLTAGHATDAASDSIGATNTASVSPTTNCLIITVGMAGHSASPNDPTISGCGLTWTKINSIKPSPNGNLYCGCFIGTGNATSGVITITPAANVQNMYWSVDQFSLVNTKNVVIQSATHNGGGSGETSESITLSSFKTSANATFSGIYVNGAITISAGSNLTILGSTAAAHALATGFEGSPNTAPGFSWTGGGNQDGAVASELNALLGGIVGEI